MIEKSPATLYKTGERKLASVQSVGDAFYAPIGFSKDMFYLAVDIVGLLPAVLTIESWVGRQTQNIRGIKK